MRARIGMMYEDIVVCKLELANGSIIGWGGRELLVTNCAVLLWDESKRELKRYF